VSCVTFGENRCFIYVGSWPHLELQGDNYVNIYWENPCHCCRKQVWLISGLPSLFCMKLRCRNAVTMMRVRSVFCNQGHNLKLNTLRIQFIEVFQFWNMSLLIIFLHQNLCDLSVQYIICPHFAAFSYLLQLILHRSSWCVKYIKLDLAGSLW